MVNLKTTSWCFKILHYTSQMFHVVSDIPNQTFPANNVYNSYCCPLVETHSMTVEFDHPDAGVDDAGWNVSCNSAGIWSRLKLCSLLSSGAPVGGRHTPGAKGTCQGQ